MSLPYRWYPMGAKQSYKPPAAGSLVAFDHSIWRVIEVKDVPHDMWTDEDKQHSHHTPYVITALPVRVADATMKGRRHFRVNSSARWSIFVYPDEHYPICSECGEPLPCRAQMAERTASTESKRVARYETAGICPACQEPVTARQKSITFDENIEMLLGPPVTFHLRSKCRWDAGDYEKRWAAADPEHRLLCLSCSGHVINHNDGTYECSELTYCPGPTARHPSYTVCRCPDCHARGTFGCTPNPESRLITDRGVS